MEQGPEKIRFLNVVFLMVSLLNKCGYGFMANLLSGCGNYWVVQSICAAVFIIALNNCAANWFKREKAVEPLLDWHNAKCYY